MWVVWFVVVLELGALRKVSALREMFMGMTDGGVVLVFWWRRKKLGLVTALRFAIHLKMHVSCRIVSVGPTSFFLRSPNVYKQDIPSQIIKPSITQNIKKLRITQDLKTCLILSTHIHKMATKMERGIYCHLPSRQIPKPSINTTVAADPRHNCSPPSLFPSPKSLVSYITP